MLPSPIPGKDGEANKVELVNRTITVGNQRELFRYLTGQVFRYCHSTTVRGTMLVQNTMFIGGIMGIKFENHEEMWTQERGGS